MKFDLRLWVSLLDGFWCWLAVTAGLCFFVFVCSRGAVPPRDPSNTPAERRDYNEDPSNTPAERRDYNEDPSNTPAERRDYNEDPSNTPAERRGDNEESR
jgi:hypothetical protein